MKPILSTLFTLALTSLLAIGTSATEASAQCVPPNLTAPDITCLLGADCNVSIGLNTNGDDFAAAGATLTSPGTIACQTPCAPGAQAAGNCFINADTCAWNVTDFSLTPFSDGEVAQVTIQCNALGTFDLDLSTASLGPTDGSSQPSCGVPGSVECVECLSDGDCGDNQFCDGAGSCVECVTDGHCDDGEACTQDSCNAGTCTNDAAAQNGASCNDGLFCTATDTCSGGVCSGAGSPCSATECADTCDEAADTCFDPAGTDCSDGLACTANDQCNGSGVCTGIALDCSAFDNSCATGVCNPSDGSCFADPLESGTSCSDGAFCNGEETCDGAGSCTAGTPENCDDGIGCTDDSCNETADSCDNVINNASCDDGAFCNGVETCDATLDCQAGTAPDCNDGIGCTDDSCNETADSCDNITNDGACDDGQFCNGVETCDATLDCRAGQFPCSDGVGCTIDGCHEPSDTCANEPSDIQCDDGLTCNGAETCDATLGCMSEVPVDCGDLDDECSFGTCSDNEGGCMSVPLEDGTPCEDGNACTIESGCAEGLCDRSTFCGVPVTRGDTPLVSDALFALRAGVELENCPLCECDVTTDDVITVVDALAILQTTVGLDVSLNCFVPIEGN